MRDLSRSGSLESALVSTGSFADVRALDVASDSSVTNAMAAIIADHGAPDVVINNAGVGSDGTTEEVPLDEFRSVIETNLFGNVRLLHALMPSWRARGRGRYISVGSVCGAIGQPFQDAYSASKFAVEGMLESLRPVASQFGIDVTVVEPGPVSTGFVTTFTNVDRALDGPYAVARGALQAIQERGHAAGQTPEEIGALLWEVANAERPALRYQSCEAVTKMVAQKLKDLSGARLVAMTERWIVPKEE